MLFSLLAWIYISFICWTCGCFTVSILRNISREKTGKRPSFSIICFIGLASLSIILSYLSLFIPLGDWHIHLFVLIASLLYWTKLKIRILFFDQFKSIFRSLNGNIIFLFAIAAFLILLMGSWTINHPDTLNYHAQNIQWIEKYK